MNLSLKNAQKQSTNSLPKSNLLGFTLLELLVVIMTMTLLFGLTYANFRDFQRRQYLESAERQVEADLRLAQQLALSGRKPDTTPDNVCESRVLHGYRFHRTNVRTYDIEAYCPGAGADAYVVKSQELPALLQIHAGGIPGNTVTFKVVSGGIADPSAAEVRLRFPQGGVDDKCIFVSLDGEINRGACP